MSLDRAANVVGALSLVITDQASDAVTEAAGRSESAAAALSALLHFLDRPSVDLLRQVLGLTSSGTVRLLDRLEESGYVERGPGAVRWICRLCDTGACRGDTGGCPVGNAARERYLS